jgi:predicted outer membrane repeat protein
MKHLFTLLFLVPALCVQAQTVKIGETTHSTIQEAINAASNNDVINITGGHTETLNFNSLAIENITLRGTNPDVDYIQAQTDVASDTNLRVITVYRPGNGLQNIFIENLGIKNGNTTKESNTSTQKTGGAILVEKLPGKLTLNNCKIHNNKSGDGVVQSYGSNIDIVESVFENNVSDGSGGAIKMVTKFTSNSTLTVDKSLFYNNTAQNGGAISLDGNITAELEINAIIQNSTFYKNTAKGTVGGGAIWSKAALSSNISLTLIHNTFYENRWITTAGVQKDDNNALAFTGANDNSTGEKGVTSFNLYNSIIVTGEGGEGTSNKRVFQSGNHVSFSNSTVMNNIIGNITSGTTSLIQGSPHNIKMKTGLQAGFSASLSLSNNVLALSSNGLAVDFCTNNVSNNVTPPTVDQRGYTRDATPDAGAYEYGASLGLFDFKDSLPFSVYPNPASQFIHIDADVEVKSVKIYSLLGALEKSIQGTNTVDISNLNKGVHLLVVESDGKQSAKQLIIE